MSKKIEVIKKKDKEKRFGKKFPEVKKLTEEKIEFAVARGSGGYKRFSKQHADYPTAEKEAVRLAKEHGGTYLVLSVVAKVYGKPKEKVNG